MANLHRSSRISSAHLSLHHALLISFSILIHSLCAAQDIEIADSLRNQAQDSTPISAPTSDPASWKIHRSFIFDSLGQPVDVFIADLLAHLQDTTGVGLPVSKQEFCEILDRDAAEIVYSRQLIKYATPKSIEIQKNDHLNLTKIRLKKKYIEAGIEFHQIHDSLLNAADNMYGVHRKDIVAILMWESNLGKNYGQYQIFNIFLGQILFLDLAYDHSIEVLSSKGDTTLFDEIDEVRRQKRRIKNIRERAIKNLAYLLRSAKASQTDPLLFQGSWGGAIGYTQFMPFRLNLAVDGDNNGEIDLCTWSDAIHSVANYLKYFGYRNSLAKRRRAIYKYNPMKSYVDGVITYADRVWEEYQTKKLKLQKTSSLK
ncbi:lytic murein transglycosylase [candidate division KSB1 bacterium]|nr:lytic murein transglycosylase [candidate division KSB1 bacterium]